MSVSIEIRQIRPSDLDSLAEFFAILREKKVERIFHPHPLTDAGARQLCEYRGKDLYFVIVMQQTVLGYAMLRGWDEGYDIPSLGIVVHPRYQGQGFGRLLMEFLRLVAQQSGAPRIRLSVYPQNRSALGLYESLGYQFEPQRDTEQQLIGYLDLTQRK